VPTRNPEGELDGKDEVICPVDFDWTDHHMIRDKEFDKLFSGVPAGVEFVWISDSCHSGDLERDIPPRNSRFRRYPVPADIRWRQITAAKIGISGMGMNQGAAAPNVALVAGCKSTQTSADAVFNRRPNGALTYYLLKELGGANALRKPLATIVKEVSQALGKAKFSQKPQLDGSPAIAAQPFLAAVS